MFDLFKPEVNAVKHLLGFNTPSPASTSVAPSTLSAINSATGFGTTKSATDPYGVNGGGGNNPVTSPTGTSSGGNNQSLQDQYNSLLYQMSSLAPGQIVGGFNVQNAYNAARQEATNTDTAFYQNAINEYNDSLNKEAGYQQQLEQNQLQGIQENLQNVLNQNALTGQRTQQDLGTTLSNMANAQQNILAQTGLSSDIARREQIAGQGASGTAESGIGQGQQADTQQGARLQSQAEQQGYNIQQAAQHLFANRTMEDLGTSSNVASQQANLQSQAANFSLSSYLSGIQAQQRQFAENSYAQQQQSIHADTLANYQTAANKFLSGLQGRTSSQNYAATANALLGAYR